MNAPGNARERHLWYGPQGSSKTRSVLDIAIHCPDATFYVLDNDDAYEQMMEDGLRNGTLPEIPNVQVTDSRLFTIDDYIDWYDDKARQADPDDWVVIDSATESWPLAQDWFSNEMYGEDIDDHLLIMKMEYEQMKASGKAGSKEGKKKSAEAASGFQRAQWQPINRKYRKLQKTYMNMPCHRIITEEADKLDTRVQDKKFKKMFSTIGMMPVGQKKWPYRARTVLYFNKEKRGDWTVTTVKDREREELDGESLEEGFAEVYLKGVAGWTSSSSSSSKKEGTPRRRRGGSPTPSSPKRRTAPKRRTKSRRTSGGGS